MAYTVLKRKNQLDRWTVAYSQAIICLCENWEGVCKNEINYWDGRIKGYFSIKKNPCIVLMLLNIKEFPRGAIKC